MYRTVKTYLKELTQFSSLRLDCVRAAETLGQDLDKLQQDYDGMNAQLAKFTEEHTRILTDSLPLVIGIAGNFNAGKSSFVNSLIGAELLGVKELPATCKVALISYHQSQLPKFYKVYKEGKAVETTRQEYLDFGVHRKRSEADQAISAAISHFEVKFHGDILREIQLVDTPGFSTDSKEDDQTAEAHLENTDMLIWVFNGGVGGPDKSEVARLHSMAKKKIVAVVNRIDDKAPGDRSAVIKEFADTYKFLRVLPYSATEAMEYQRRMGENEKAFATILEKSREFRAAGKEFVIGSKEKSFYIRDSGDAFYEVPRSEVRESPYSAYHRDLLAAIREIRKEMTTIKEERFRQELQAYHQREVDHWMGFKARLHQLQEQLTVDYNAFINAIQALNRVLIGRAQAHFGALKDDVLKQLFDTVFFFEHKPEAFFKDAENYVKRRELTDSIKEKARYIIEQQFKTYRGKLVADFNKGLQRMEIGYIPDDDQKVIGIFQDKLSLSSYEGFLGMMAVWQPYKFAGTNLEANKKMLDWIDLFVSSNHFSNITLYYLQTIYDRIMAARRVEYDATYNSQQMLVNKINQTLRTISD